MLANKLGVSPKEQFAGFQNTILRGRGQTADEVARAALFLYPNQSVAITGQSINVDGGTSAPSLAAVCIPRSIPSTWSC